MVKQLVDHSKRPDDGGKLVSAKETIFVDVSIGDYDNGQLVINIAYKLKDQHDSRSLVYPFYLLPEAE